MIAKIIVIVGLILMGIIHYLSIRRYNKIIKEAKEEIKVLNDLRELDNSLISGYQQVIKDLQDYLKKKMEELQ